MPQYIALFRGINVGGRNRLPMKELSALLEDLGYSDIRTYIQSGNVVFRGKKRSLANLAGEISQAVRQAKGFEPKVLLLTAEELGRAVAHNPFPTDDGKALHFWFLDAKPQKPDLAKLASLQAATEDYKLQNKVFYLYAPDGIGRSKLAAGVEKALGVPVTARNWNTIAKLKDMVD